MEQSSRKQVFVTIAIIAVLFVVVVGTLLLTKKKAQKSLNATTPTAESTSNPPATSSPSTSASTTFKDGSYKATGSYTSPGGNESITVNVTLKDGVVTDTSATSGANDSTAKQYQGEFIAGYKDQVVGKKISAIKLSRVSGSSLTSQGFNSAIQQIQQQAKA